MFRKRRRRGKSRLTGAIALLGLCGLAFAGYRIISPSPKGGNDTGDETTLGAEHVMLDESEISARPRGMRASRDEVANGDQLLGMEERSFQGALDNSEEPDRTAQEGDPALFTMGERLPGSEHEETPTRRKPASTPAPEAMPTINAWDFPEALQDLVNDAEASLARGESVRARDAYVRALYHPDTPSAQANDLRRIITRLNDDILFSPKLHPAETRTRVHTVQSGEVVSTINRREGTDVGYGLIAHVNRMSNPNKVFLGQKLKIVQGPFHAEVIKSAYRMDIYSGPADEPDKWQYVRSFKVGLGEQNGTPVGEFIIKRDSKLENPAWVNPRTGERFAADDPENPIGEYWMGLKGIGASEIHESYGIHGTIDPESIGGQQSMGCVRLGDDDIAFVYNLLVEEKSRVRIVP
jgi:nucleoid-associated protein YgaU